MKPMSCKGRRTEYWNRILTRLCKPDSRQVNFWINDFFGLMIMDHRKFERHDCFVEARAFVGGSPAIVCRIMDITPDGAKLVAETNIPPANKLLVLIPCLVQVWAAEVRWRRGNECGVRFRTGEADLAKPPAGSEPDLFALALQTSQLRERRRRLSAGKSP
jgi:PilZ domain